MHGRPAGVIWLPTTPVAVVIVAPTPPANPLPWPHAGAIDTGCHLPLALGPADALLARLFGVDEQVTVAKLSAVAVDLMLAPMRQVSSHPTCRAPSSGRCRKARRACSCPSLRRRAHRGSRRRAHAGAVVVAVRSAPRGACPAPAWVRQPIGAEPGPQRRPGPGGRCWCVCRNGASTSLEVSLAATKEKEKTRRPALSTGAHCL